MHYHHHRDCSLHYLFVHSFIELFMCLFIYLLCCVLVCGHISSCHVAHTEDRGQLAGVTFLLLLCESWELNSSLKT